MGGCSQHRWRSKSRSVSLYSRNVVMLTFEEGWGLPKRFKPRNIALGPSGDMLVNIASVICAIYQCLLPRLENILKTETTSACTIMCSRHISCLVQSWSTAWNHRRIQIHGKTKWSDCKQDLVHIFKWYLYLSKRATMTPLLGSPLPSFPRPSPLPLLSLYTMRASSNAST